MKAYVRAVWSWWHGQPRKLMALFTDYSGFFDDSGHETRDFLICGGLMLDVGDAHQQNAFETEWHEAIKPLVYLHTTDYIAGDRDFKAFKNTGLGGKRELLVRAAKVIAKYSLQTFSAALVMEDYCRINNETVFSEVVAYPFSLCARFASVQVSHWAKFHAMNERVKLIFERRTGQGEIDAVFVRDKLDPPSFEGKDVCGLQAADLIAWTHQGKATNSLNYQRIGKDVKAELVASLHTADTIRYQDMRRTLRLGTDGLDMARAAMKNGVAFRQTPKNTRTRFKK
ncbi:MAG TPA: hypothetical protein VIX14_08670 [Terriglobales bacterium]